MFAAAVMLLATAVAVGVAKKLELGWIVGLLAVGMALGPHSPMPLFTGHVAEMQAIGEIGVTLLIFAVALDLQPKQVWSMRHLVFGLGTMQYVVTTAVLLVFVAVSYGIAQKQWGSVLVVSLGLAMSSAAIPLPMLQERGESATLQGRAVISIDMFQGFMVVPVLALIPILGAGSAGSGHLFDTQKTVYVVGALVGVYILGRYVLPQVLALTARGLGPGGFVPIALSAVFFAGWWMEEVGISMALGAFMIGVLLSTTVYVEEVKAAVTPARRFLLAVFFIAIGMAIDPRQLFELKTDLLLYLPALLAIKFVVLFLLARLFRFPLRQAILTGLLMMPFDEIGYVILASANSNGLLNARDYTLGLSVISLSFVVSPMLINLGYKLSERLKDREPESAQQTLSPTEPGSVVVAGYAYVGRTICAMLEQARIRYTAYEVDPDWLAIAEKMGHNVRYGDLGNSEMMGAIAIDRARLVIASNGAHVSTRRMIDHLRQFYASVPVIVAVPYLAQRDEIRHTVGTEVFALIPEGALSFGRRVLDRLGVQPSQTEVILDSLKIDDYAAHRTIKGEGPDAAETTSAVAK